jgi:hypothetical protein
MRPGTSLAPLRKRADGVYGCHGYSVGRENRLTLGQRRMSTAIAAAEVAATIEERDHAT